MSFRQMKIDLAKALSDHYESVRICQSGNDPSRRTRIPVLSGPSGIGKSACVDEFAAENEFEVIHLDCSYEPANFLVFHINNAINDIRDGSIKGCLLHIDFFDEADEEWHGLFDQYCRNRMSCQAEMQSGKDKVKHQFSFDKIPEQIFIVGESHASS